MDRNWEATTLRGSGETTPAVLVLDQPWRIKAEGRKAQPLALVTPQGEGDDEPGYYEAKGYRRLAR